MNTFRAIFKYIGFAGNALGQTIGRQISSPSTELVDGSRVSNVDAALQISSVWRAIELVAKTIASLPIMVWEEKKSGREYARDSILWNLFHESPNARMTPMEFWVAMLLNLLLRGNGYARIDRSSNGEAYAIWPMPADQVEMDVLDDGSVLYYYRINNDVAVLAEENVFHIKEMGNGTAGLSRLDYMRATTTEISNSQNAATKLFTNGGKPTGILMVDDTLKKEQRNTIRKNFAEMAEGSTSRLFVLEADMKYQQITMSPEDMQLLETRRYGVEEIGRWFGVPGELMNSSTVAKYGKIEDLVSLFHKFTIRPALVSLEQALRKRVMTSAQRVRLTCEFNLDALLRASLLERVEIYSKKVQNGLGTRNECRAKENEKPLPGGDGLTVQSNLVPIEMLGRIKQGGGNVPQDTIAQ